MVTGTLGVEKFWAAVVSGKKVDGDPLRPHMPHVFVPALALDSLLVNASGKIDPARLKSTFAGGAS